jgi:hypothetical protein
LRIGALLIAGGRLDAPRPGISVGSRRIGVAVAALVAALGVTPVGSLAQGADLPVLGTLTYNLLDYDTRTGHTAQPKALRFVGRIGLRVQPQTYVGFAVGSWVRVYEGCSGADGCAMSRYDEYGEVVNHALFVQYYIKPRWFTRAGAGVALTEVLTPNGETIASDRHARGSLTAGTGVDLPLARRLLLMPSVDYTLLPGTPTGGAEIHWAIAYGVGITLR